MRHRPEPVESNFTRSPVGGHRPDFRIAAASSNDDAGAETPADEAMAQRPSWRSLYRVGFNPLRVRDAIDQLARISKC
jgi:hypothetical protein